MWRHSFKDVTHTNSYRAWYVYGPQDLVALDNQPNKNEQNGQCPLREIEEGG